MTSSRVKLRTKYRARSLGEKKKKKESKETKEKVNFNERDN